MSDKVYLPPNVWEWNKGAEARFSNINRPVAGETHVKSLPRGRHGLQLYSLATPNGVKVTILLEELLEAGITEADYDAWPINILEGDQFSSGFVEINPNSKIPALVDYSAEQPISVFESGSILLYLAEKFERFIPLKKELRIEMMNWLFWQIGSAPYLGGGFGHFYAYAPEKIKYCIDRFTMEVKRQLDVLDRHLADKQYMCGSDYTIADMAILPWYGGLVENELYGAAEFLGIENYENLNRWTRELMERSAVKRGRIVNKTWGEEEGQLAERHSSSDFHGKNI